MKKITDCKFILSRNFKLITFGSHYILFVLFFVCTIFANSICYAQLNKSLTDLPNLLYTDANSLNGNKNTGNFTLDGDATILLGDVFLSANKIIIQKDIGLIFAEGNVKLIYQKEKVIASKIVIDMNTKQMRMDDAQIFSDPTETDERFSQEALGFTKAEVAFDQSRSQRVEEIKSEMSILREEYVRYENLKSIKGKNNSEVEIKILNLRRRYSQLLARLFRTQYQPNSILESIPEQQREKFLDRRKSIEKFNKDNPVVVKQVADFSMIQGFLKLSASRIIQKDQNNFILNDSVITPCRCSSMGEPPIFGFSSQESKIETSQYITMKSVTIDVLSIPLFYSPFLIFPLKNKRESGFLLPSGYMSNNAGQEIGIPYFVVLGEHADSTITLENFSKRGSQFNGEFRAQITPESEFYSENKFIQDKLYQKNSETNSKLVDNAIASTTDPDTKAKYEGYRGKNIPTRWYTENSLNVPMSDWSSFKFNGQVTSDNTYLSDFSMSNTNIDPISAVFGDTSSASRRFLNQEASFEYYGENVVLSLRGQKLQDLFAIDSDSTPKRTPKLEFYLLPKRYFNNYISFSNISSWENIIRENGPIGIISPSPSSPLAPPNRGKNLNPNKYKTEDEPYLQGKRLNSSSTISLPLMANDYVNASLSSTVNISQYYFSGTKQLDPNITSHYTTPFMEYVQYNAHLDVPMYASTKINYVDSNKAINITQNFTPFFDINYVPNVFKSSNFPNTYQLWYAGDSASPGNAVSASNVSLGLALSWKIEKEEFVETDSLPARINKEDDPGLANIKFFSESVREKGLSISSHAENIFHFSSDSEALAIFDLWTQKELKNYYEKVTRLEFNRGFVWPTGKSYTKQVVWSMDPLSLSLSTGYNFLAEKTAQEINDSAGSNVTPVDVQKLLDINVTAGSSLAPFIPLTSTFGVAYSQLYHRINSQSYGFSLSLPYNFSVTYGNNQQYVLNPINQTGFIKKTQQNLSITSKPLAWLQFGFQWAQSVDPTTTLDSRNGKGYAASENISFLNFQDCLDLVIARNKAAGIPENLATYAIGFNLKIFGYTKGFNQVGDYLNRKLQR